MFQAASEVRAASRVGILRSWIRSSHPQRRAPFFFCQGIVSLFPIQGLENNVAYWTQAVLTEAELSCLVMRSIECLLLWKDMVNGPLVFPGAAAHWSFDSASLSRPRLCPATPLNRGTCPEAEQQIFTSDPRAVS